MTAATTAIHSQAAHCGSVNLGNEAGHQSPMASTVVAPATQLPKAERRYRGRHTVEESSDLHQPPPGSRCGKGFGGHRQDEGAERQQDQYHSDEGNAERTLHVGLAIARGKRLLRGEGAGVFRGTIDPVLDLRNGGESRRFHQDPGLHRTPGQIEHSRVWLSQSPGCFLRAESDDQGIPMHAAAHVPLQQEGDPAKHLPLSHPAARAQVRSNARRQPLVKCHRTRG
jgi:hypothetical protein